MDIVKIVQETATWIEKVNNDYELNLYRSPELIPDRHFIYIPEDKQAEAVSSIVKKRSELLANSGASLIPTEDLPQYGRLMIFYVNDTVCDGAPQDISKYYVDINDAPPVDTWVAFGSQLQEAGMLKEHDPYLEQAIIAWVPESQYFYANEALFVACVDNFAWPNPNWLTDSYSDLKGIFSSPNEFKEPAYPIHLLKRMQLMKEFEDKLDKNSPQY